MVKHLFIRLHRVEGWPAGRRLEAAGRSAGFQTGFRAEGYIDWKVAFVTIPERFDFLAENSEPTDSKRFNDSKAEFRYMVRDPPKPRHSNTCYWRHASGHFLFRRVIYGLQNDVLSETDTGLESGGSIAGPPAGEPRPLALVQNRSL